MGANQSASPLQAAGGLDAELHATRIPRATAIHPSPVRRPRGVGVVAFVEGHAVRLAEWLVRRHDPDVVASRSI